MTGVGRPAWVEVDLAAIRHNTHRIQEHIGPRCGILAVVKANAYGHGLVPVAEAAAAAGASGLAVAILSEAVALREAGIAAPILVLGTVLPDEAGDAVARDVVASPAGRAESEALSAAAERLGKPARAHLKVDSGMGRRGAFAAEAPELAKQVHALPGVRLEGVFTHFSTADDADPTFAREQLRAFRGCLAQMRADGTLPPAAHAANSAAILRLREGHFDLVRPGLLLYGVPPYPGAEGCLGLRPALSLKARVVAVKDLPQGACVGYGRAYLMERPGRVAIVPLGYADGFSRHNSNRGDALVRGRRVPIRGRICMDQLIVDITDVPEARVGDEVVLLGRQGAEEIPVAEISQRTDTITHETLSALTDRLPRQYTDA